MQIIYIVHDLDQASGGPSESIPNLASSVSKIIGKSVTLIHWNLGHKQIDKKPFHSQIKFIEVEKAVRVKTLLDSVLNSCINSSDTVIHCHGLWDLLSHWACKYAQSNRIPYIVSPRGMLDPWCMNHKRWKKNIGWFAYQKSDLDNASCIHSTAEHETRRIKELGFKNPIVCLPNGYNVKKQKYQKKQSRKKRITFISRIHPVKGLPLLLYAWAKLKPNGWECIIAGPNYEEHLDEVKCLALRIGVMQSFVFRPFVFGEEKLRLIESSCAVVLPSYSENFGMIVAESLAAGTPVITTEGTPWSDLNKYECGWWIKRDLDCLCGALTQVFNSSLARINEMGHNGIKLIQKKYPWEPISNNMVSVYAWALRPKSNLDFKTAN